MRLSSRGFTLVEVIVAVGLSGIVIFFLVRFLNTGGRFMQESKARQEVTADLRTAMDLINQLLSRGRASTLVIDDPYPTNMASPGACRARFTTTNGSRIEIAWRNDRTITLTETPPGLAVRDPKIIARNVTGLHFSGDYRDPGLLYVTIRLDIPLDQSGRADRMQTSTLFNQAIRLVTTTS